MKPAALIRVLAGSILVAALSRGAADPDLERLEREYLAQRDVIVRPVLTGFAEKLRSLHARLSQSHDPRAAAVKLELDRTIVRLSPPTGSDASPPTGTKPSGGEGATARGPGGVVELRGPKAVMSGDAVYDERIVAGVQFKAKGATAVWNLPTLKPGRYRVRIEWGCAPGLGALARMAFGDQPSRTLTVQPTGESAQVTSFNFGEVDLPPGIATLKIEMVDAPPRAKVTGGFTLHLIAITPAEG